MRDTLKRLISRKLSEESTVLQEDLRKIGLVLVGAGIVGVILQGNFYGFLLVAFGAAAWIFGLTEQRKDDVDDS